MKGWNKGCCLNVPLAHCSLQMRNAPHWIQHLVWIDIGRCGKWRKLRKFGTKNIKSSRHSWMVQRVPSWRHRQVGITLEGQNLSLVGMVSPLFYIVHVESLNFLTGAEVVPSVVVLLKMLIFVVACFIHCNIPHLRVVARPRSNGGTRSYHLHWGRLGHLSEESLQPKYHLSCVNLSQHPMNGSWNFWSLQLF